ncbi:MAG TPA: DUF5103 domain-containing protein [Bacteroidales bacterium]|nr:DUF5103 domain-containing protein [Bacteroidales bacterium]
MKILFIIAFSVSSLLLQGQQDYPDSVLCSNHIYNYNIKTVQLYRDGWNLSYPIMKLNSDDRLILQFDQLGDQPETYYYTFSHCSKDWKKSDIFQGDYLDGFPENPVEDYEASFNTTVSYFHYKLSFPNDIVKLKLSGNYIITVYPAGKPEEPVLTQRFIITEDAAAIDIKAHRPQATVDNNALQQIDFTVNYSGIDINDTYRDINAFVLQNGRWDNAKRNLKPDFTGNNELQFNSLSDRNIFRGGNEFRYFDTKSIKYQTEYVSRIDYAAPFYNFYLKPSEDREFKPYYYWQDFNGKYYVAVEDGKNFDLDADYVYVYFTLPSRQMVSGGKMYVSGNLNNWNLDKNNLMTYNNERGEYECTMLLKQGWYNYEYVFQKDGSSDAVATVFEGSHYETENDYVVLVYYKNPRDRYDRVIGSAVFNTLNNIAY